MASIHEHLQPASYHTILLPELELRTISNKAAAQIIFIALLGQGRYIGDALYAGIDAASFASGSPLVQNVPAVPIHAVTESAFLAAAADDADQPDGHNPLYYALHRTVVPALLVLDRASYTATTDETSLNDADNVNQWARRPGFAPESALRVMFRFTSDIDLTQRPAI